MRLTSPRRRRSAATVLAVGLLAGCGTTDDSADPADSDGASTADAAATAVWEGPAGPVDVPLDPQRVVAGFSVDADFALALGLPVVGAPGALATPGLPFAEYHADRLEGVEVVASGAEPNLEQLLALQPDLILDSYDTEPARAESLNSVAPTLSFGAVLYPDDFARTDWQGALTALGETLGREEEAAEAIAEYDAVIAEGREELADLAGETFAPINGFGAEGAIVIDQGQLIAQVATDLGLVPDDLVGADPSSRTTLSLEELGRLRDVDHLLFAAYPAEDSLARETANAGPVLDSPLWQQLPAVRGDGVVTYDGEIYYASPLTAVALARQLIEALDPA